MSDFTRILSQLQTERNQAQQAVDRLDEAIRAIQGVSRDGRRSAGSRGAVRGRRRLSAAARARIAAAQRRRWAKVKQGKAITAVLRSTPKRKISRAARNRMAAAQRARWAKHRQQQAGKKSAAA